MYFSLIPYYTPWQIRHFLTDLAQIWYMNLILSDNSKSEAISWIRGWYHVEVGDYLQFSLNKLQTPLNNNVAIATSWVPGDSKLYFQMLKSESFISLLQTVLMQHKKNL